MNSKHSSTHAQETVAQVDATIVVDVKSLFVAQTSDYNLQKPQFLAEIVHFRPDTASVVVDLKSACNKRRDPDDWISSIARKPAAHPSRLAGLVLELDSHNNESYPILLSNGLTKPERTLFLFIENSGELCFFVLR